MNIDDIRGPTAMRRGLRSIAGQRRTSGAAVLPLDAAKVSRPQTHRTPIHRRRLFAKLDAAVHQPVTVIRAGAGWGKTMLASSWAAAQPISAGWLALDAHDNDVQIFWSYVLEALRAAGALRPDNPLADLRTIPADKAQRVSCFAAGFGRLSAPTVLVLDDFQEVNDPTVIAELAELLRRPPPPLHLILNTRSEPLLPLHRLRATGELTDISAADLAFTVEEAAELLDRHDLTLSVEDVAALLHRTEGWPAGLQLAADFLAAPGGPRPVAEFTGDVRPVDQYVVHEVLAAHPPHLRRFLFMTSICGNLCGDLADAVTLQTDGRRTLEELERVNGFVVRLGAKPERYRYHPLLRDVLRHRLLTELPTIVPELHRRAARWNAAHQLIFEALNHAVAAQDWPYLGELVVTHAAPLILSANRSAFMKILSRVPPEELYSTAELMLCGALVLFDAGDLDAIPDRLAGALRMLAGRSDEDRLPAEIPIRALQGTVHRVVGDMPALITEATLLLATVSKVRAARLRPVMQYRAIALADKGIGLFLTGRADHAGRYLWAASTAARASAVELVEIDAIGHLALLEAMRGSVTESARWAGYARDLAERRGWVDAPQYIAARLARGLVGIERNELARAHLALRHDLRTHRSEPEAADRLIWLGARARLALAQSEPARARTLLEEAGRQRARRLRAPAVDRWLLLTESEVDLQTGLLERVEARYAALASTEEPTFPEQVCRARAAFAARDLQRAEDLLAGTSRAMSETVATVTARILTALIADARGHGLEVIDALAAALALAEPEGIRRPFLALAGGRLDGLLGRQSLLSHRNNDFITDIRNAMRAGDRRAQPSYPAGDLSLREAEVLQYLPTMLTAGEIAVELGVSINTVKAHMRSIYRKLDVGRRREAVVRAHEHGML